MERALLDEVKISTLLGSLNSNYWRVRVLAETTSTQDELKHELVSNGECVVTEFQSAGRGRLDRRFDSIPGVALLSSFYIEPIEPIEPIDHIEPIEPNNKKMQSEKARWGAIPLLVGIAIARTLNSMSDCDDYLIKWPNDIVTRSGKVCGILCERFNNGIIVGIGINVTSTPEELPVETASSIFIASGMVIDRNELLVSILQSFHALFDLWQQGRDFRGSYRALSGTIGKEIVVTLPAGHSLHGTAIDITSRGELVLDSGEILSVGDVVHLR